MPIDNLAAFSEAISARVGEAVDEACLTFCSGGQGVTYSYREYLSLVHALARYFKDGMGLTPEHRVSILSENNEFVPALLLALFRIGCDIVPMNPREDAQSWLHVVADAHVDWVLTDKPRQETVQRSQLPSRTKVQLLDDVVRHSSRPGAEASPPPASRQSQRRSNLILHTSGTTGRPKGVVLPEAALVANAQSLIRHFNLNRVRHLCTLPLYHAHALGLGFLTTFLSGGHLILCDGLELGQWSKLVAKYKVEFTSVVPAQLFLLEKFRQNPDHLTTLRRLVVSSAPVTQAIAQSFEEKTGVSVCSGWGLSEYTNFATCSLTEPSTRVASLYAEDWPSIGVPLEGVDLRIVLEPEQGQTEAPAGEIGELLLDGPCLFQGYLNNPKETAASRSGAFLKTGDLGYWKEVAGKRHFFVTGRKKEFINRGGDKVSPIVVEERVGKLSRGQAYAILGFEHEILGEEIGMYVLGDDLERDGSAVVDQVASRLPDSFMPRVILFGEEPIPTTITGKVQRLRLRPLFEPYRRYVGNTEVYRV